MPATENRVQLTNLACNFALEKGNFEGDFAVKNGRKFESEERKFESEENTVRIHVQWI